MLKIENLHATIDNKEILKGLNLSVKKGEVHAVMGPNGSGKSTLARVLTGDPRYEVTQGSVLYNQEDLIALSPEDRALAGVFMAFQYPTEIPGVSNESFLRLAYNLRQKKRGQDELDPMEFRAKIKSKFDASFGVDTMLKRSVNHGFSGGEKKRNEMFQLSVLDPQLAILDETDSGLDIDALRIVSEGINQFRSQDNAIMLITHYHRLLQYVKPDFVHILSDGNIVQSGNVELALELEEKGYENISCKA